MTWLLLFAQHRISQREFGLMETPTTFRIPAQFATPNEEGYEFPGACMVNFLSLLRSCMVVAFLVVIAAVVMFTPSF